MEYIWTLIDFFKGDRSNCSRPVAENTSSGGNKRKAEEAFQDDKDQEDLMPAKRCKPPQFPDENDEPGPSSGGRKRKVKEAFQDDEDQEDLMPAKRCKPTQFPDESDNPGPSSGGRKRKVKEAFQDDEDQEDLMPAKRCKPTQFPDESDEPGPSSGGRKRKVEEAFQDDEDQEDLMPAKRCKPTQFPDESDEPGPSSGGRKRKVKEAFQDDEDQEDLMPAKRCKPTQFPDESDEPGPSSGGRKRKVEKAFQDDEDQEDLMPAKRCKPTQFPDESYEPGPSSGGRGRKRKVEEAFEDDEDQENLMLTTWREPPQFPDDSDESGTSSDEGASQDDEDLEDFQDPSQFPNEDDEDEDDSSKCKSDVRTTDSSQGSPLDNYELGRKLGKGHTGTVYLATRKSDGKKVALKFVHESDLDPEYIVEMPGYAYYAPLEAELLLELQTSPICPHIIELYDFFDVGEHYIYVLEYMQPSMTLTAFIRRNNGRLTESVARHLTLQILLALQNCLEHGIYHKAVHEDNILVNPKTLQVKLIDFGNSDYFRGRLKPHVGLDQIYCRCHQHSRLVKSCGFRPVHFALEENVTSVARLLARMVNGYWPLRSVVEYPRFHPSVSKECRDLLTMCFRFRFDFGPTIEDVIDHKWFSLKEKDI
ncbi:uncharacterized protein isoform X4 [Danio rerio]|uniref:Uncharacterized protein isoform X4 n=3 Tax=Danio rerio TaxID=7955 RepID=A0AC58JLD5_DANRE